MVMPSSFAATPGLAEGAAGKVRLTHEDGEASFTSDGSMWTLTMDALKWLHIPKMTVPTGLTEDGRPCAIQLWGRALSYEEMFDDSAGVENDLGFLELVRRVAGVIQAEPSLARQDAAQVQQLLASVGAAAQKSKL